MGPEILLLFILVGITLLGYIMAINSHGPTRLSISYLIATLILAGTVWAIVQHVNSGLDKMKMAEFKKLEQEKQKAEERIHSQEQTLLEHKKRMGSVAKLNDVVNQGTGLATTIMNIDLRDFSAELDVLVARASNTKQKTRALIQDFEKLEINDDHFTQSIKQIREALNQLNEASKYYLLYFRSEDSAQEELRERILRQKSRKAYELFKNASSLIVSGS